LTRSDAPPAGQDRGFRAYALGLGAASLFVVGQHLLGDRELVVRQGLPILVFSLLIGFAWYFSFAIFPRAHLSISLDMAYMMTAVCVLPRPLPMAVAVLGSIIGVSLRSRDPDARIRPVIPVLCLNMGGMVLVALTGQLLSIRMGPLWRFDLLTWGTVASILALFVTYNLTNLLVMSVAVALKGDPLLPYLWRFLRYMPTLEIFTPPMCLGLALLYAAAGVWGFTPLAATILVGSGLLKKLHRARSELSQTNEQLRDRSRELRALHTIGNQITASLDPHVVFSQISTNLQRILDAPYLILALKHRWPNEHYEEFISRHGVVQPPPERPLGEGFTHWMVETRRPLILADLETDRNSLPCAPVILDRSVRSILAAPLIVTHGAIGALCVESPRPGAYSLDHLSVLTTIAQQAAIAIENARNFQLATVDQLTQLYLRDFFMRKVKEEKARARRYGSTFAVLMLDLDSFKELNDQLGHVAGDRFLQKVGEAIRESMREPDVPCRFGGEEFCVLLPEADAEGAHAIAERIRTRVAGIEVTAGERSMSTTVSIGVSCYPEDHADSIEGLIDNADRALYAAKKSGRNRTILARAILAATGGGGPGAAPGGRRREEGEAVNVAGKTAPAGRS
jgi:diguanylate cyclase (GGDEF)-like protein